MNKQEAIEKINKLKMAFATKLAKAREKSLSLISGVTVVELQDVIDIVNQIDEQKKPVIPQFVADWYENYKDEFEYYLKGFISKVDYHINHNTKNQFYQWLGNPYNDPILTLVNMHQFGYEVEKEKLYTARLKVVTISCVKYINKCSDGAIVISDLNTASGNYKTSFTRSELEELNVWDNPAFEIEEVE